MLTSTCFSCVHNSHWQGIPGRDRHVARSAMESPWRRTDEALQVGGVGRQCAAGASTVVVATAVQSGADERPQVQRIVVPEADQFTPFAATVRVGEVVQWVNRDTDDHTVVSDDAFNTAGHKGVDLQLVGTDRTMTGRARWRAVQPPGHVRLLLPVPLPPRREQPAGCAGAGGRHPGRERQLRHPDDGCDHRDRWRGPLDPDQRWPAKHEAVGASEYDRTGGGTLSQSSPRLRSCSG